MRKQWKSEEFKKALIAQGDTGGYDPSGYAVVVEGDLAAVGYFSHCSCYSTFTSLVGGGISDHYDEGEVTWTWEGTVEELLRMASLVLDPALPLKEADAGSYDYKPLVDTYTQVLAWHAGRKCYQGPRAGLYATLCREALGGDADARVALYDFVQEF